MSCLSLCQHQEFHGLSQAKSQVWDLLPLPPPLYSMGIIKDSTLSVGVELVFFISILSGSTDYILWSFEPETVSQVILHK